MKRDAFIVGCARTLAPRMPTRQPHRDDKPRPDHRRGMVIVALASITDAIIDAPRAGWSSATTLGMLTMTLVAVGGLLAYEPRRIDPLLELRFFGSDQVSGATGISRHGSGGFLGLLFTHTAFRPV